ncbi:hypothetical protein A2V94_06430 [Candidatus Atribacteria bacterium RBG_16_35_8]|nr:MAG: hypothetical protein A2V94_06430 [Candidatus Atribacteria bacterium RBG_16_35_8]
MNFFRRAVLSSIYHKKRFLLMFMIILIASVLLQVSYQVRLTASESVKQIRKKIGASVTVYLVGEKIWSTNLYPFNEASYYSYDIAEEMAALPEVKEAKYLCMANAIGKNISGVKNPMWEKIKEEYGTQDSDDEGDFNMVGLTDLQSYWNLKRGEDHMIEGEPITAADSGMPYVILSQTVMEINNLNIGDAVSFSSYFDNSRSVELEIVGTHSGDDNSWTQECANNINYIYTPVEVAMELNGIDGIMEAEYVLKDPIEMESFLSEARSISDKYQIDLKFVENNLDFLLASTALKGLIRTCDAIFITVLVLAAIILSLLVIYFLNERLFEVGILLSLGEKKYRIALQVILEILMPAILAINIGIIIAGYLIPVIGKAVGTTMEISQQLTSVNILYLFLLINCCGILLVITSSIIPFITIKRYSPKEILQRFK